MEPQRAVDRAQDIPRLRLLSVMAPCLAIGGALFTITTLVLWWLGSGDLLDTAGAGVITLFGIISYILTRQRRVLLAGTVVVALLLIIVTYYVVVEGPKNTGVLLFVGAIVFADLLLGGNSSLLVAGIGAALYLGAGLPHHLQWIAPSYRSGFPADVATVVLVGLGLALASRSFTRELRRALREAGEREAGLQAASADQDRLMAELQAREQAQRRLLETVRELGSPVIPLAEGVIAMPLIGRLDSQRAQEVVRVLLQGVAEHRARVALVDITGVPAVDTAVANALIQAAQGVSLLGATPVLVGIRAEVAQTIVDLGVDLGGIITRANLQEGLTYAVEQVGRAG